MPHKIGFVTNSGGKLAHKNMVQVVKEFAEANGWAVMRFVDNAASHELILKAPGLSGLEEIFVGMRTYENAAADFYNITAAGFVGYVPGNSFASQPGAFLSGVPAHNTRIDYWLTLNGQRLVLVMKVGTPVYESMYLGKMLPYARPDQYPYPVIVGGMLPDESGIRYSETTHGMPFKGGRANFRLRFNDGSWLLPTVHPWNSRYIAGWGAQTRDTNGFYPLMPCTLISGANQLGELDGVHQITGFDNAVENTLEIDGVTYVVIQDVARTGFNDYFAMRLDV